MHEHVGYNAGAGDLGGELDALFRVFDCAKLRQQLRHIRHGPDPALALVLRLGRLHQQVLALLGPAYEEFYKSTN